MAAATFISLWESARTIQGMTEALAAVQTDAPTQETGPLPRLTERDRRRASATVARPAPGRYLAIEDGGEVVLFALGREEGTRLRIGRSPASDILIDDPSVSRRHAVVVHRGGRTVILDDRSLNGVLVNGRRVGEAALADGDTVALGRVTARFHEIPEG
jgi:pSer/pThr/pTyr-binding forkhead associated (FHA) protein